MQWATIHSSAKLGLVWRLRGGDSGGDSVGDGRERGCYMVEDSKAVSGIWEK